MAEFENDLGEGGEAGAYPGNLLGSRRIFHEPPTPKTLFEFIRNIRKHENGSVDQKHPDIMEVMRRARREKLDVILTPDGNGINAVTGKNIVYKGDNIKFIKIGAGVAITATLVGGAAGFIIRQHRRSK